MRISAVLLTLLSLLVTTSCFETPEERQQNVRPGCVKEKMRENGYTEEYALGVCEGQAYMYGNNQRPQYEIELDKFRDQERERKRECYRSNVREKGTSGALAACGL